MLSYSQATKLAELRAEYITGGLGQILPEKTIKKPYSWIYFFQSKKFLATNLWSDAFVGNAPFLVDRFEGEIRIFGTADPIDQFVEKFERELPPYALKHSSPEEPPEPMPLKRHGSS